MKQLTENEAFNAAHVAYPELDCPDIAIALNMPDHPNWAVWHHNWTDQVIITDGIQANLFKMVDTREVPQYKFYTRP
jgi:hypothetical protein